MPAAVGSKDDIKPSLRQQAWIEKDYLSAHVLFAGDQGDHEGQQSSTTEDQKNHKERQELRSTGTGRAEAIAHKWERSTVTIIVVLSGNCYMAVGGLCNVFVCWSTCSCIGCSVCMNRLVLQAIPITNSTHFMFTVTLFPLIEVYKQHSTHSYNTRLPDWYM